MWAVPSDNRGYSEKNHLPMILAVVAMALAVRVAFASVYSVAMFRDSEDYLLLAKQLSMLDLHENSGWRTPLYPLLVILASQNHDAIWFLQALMGVVISVLVYFLLAKSTGSRLAGFVGALVQALAVNQLALEASILAETMSTLFVVAAVYAADRAWRQNWKLRWICAAALLSALAALTRPLYITLLPVVLLLVLWPAPVSRPRAAFTFAAVFVAPLLVWMAIQSVTIGSFSITTLLGYNLTTHVGRIVERAPEEFSAIRDTFVEYRKRITAEGGSVTMTIFSAKPEIEELTGLNAVQLSRELTKMSIGLIISNPSDYLRSVGKAWIHFFGYLVTMLEKENFTSELAWNFFDTMDWIQRWLFRLMYLGFLVSVLPLIYVGLINKKGSDKLLNTGVLMALLVLVTSVLQALLQFGGNGRFSLPTQTLAAASVIVCVVSLRNHLRGRRIR